MSIAIPFRPIISALTRHKTAAVLLVLEIALTLAIIGNLVFVVSGNLQRAHTSTGVMENDIGFIQSIVVMNGDNPGNVANSVALLRQVPGVADAAYGGPPLWYGSPSNVFTDSARQHKVVQAYEFIGGQDLAATLGVRVVQGRGITLDDRGDPAKWGQDIQIGGLITSALAERMFPGENPLGQRFYDGTMTIRVVGVMDHLRGEVTGRPDDDYSMVVEFQLGAQDMGGGFMIRSQPGQLGAALQAAASAMQKANPGHVQNRVVSMPVLRQQYFATDMATNRMLIAIMTILLVVTALGVGGLGSFWVQQRRRQIGMRRALGATRGDILRYFQAENFLIVAAGVALGVVLAYALNLFLMHRFELGRLPVGYPAFGAVTLWVLGQLAVLGPALRAAAVPPVEATRGV